MTTNTGAFITTGDSTLSIYPLLQSGSGAAYSGNNSKLVDGLPGTQTAITWLSDTPANTDYIEIVWRVTPAPVTATECRVFALLGLRGINAGTRVRLYGGSSANPASLLRSTNVVELPDGTLGVWAIFAEGSGYTHEYYGWRIFNDISGSPYIAASATVYAGEVFAASCQEWPVASFGDELDDPSILNRASGNQARSVMRYPFRKYEIGIVQQRYADAFINETRSLQRLRYALARAKYVAVIPRPRDRGSAFTDDANANAQGILASVTVTGQISSDAIRDRWPLQLQFAERL